MTLLKRLQNAYPDLLITKRCDGYTAYHLDTHRTIQAKNVIQLRSMIQRMNAERIDQRMQDDIRTETRPERPERPAEPTPSQPIEEKQVIVIIRAE